jgi:hypothetical protein
VNFAILLVLTAASLLDVVMVAFGVIGSSLGFWIGAVLMALLTMLYIAVSREFDSTDPRDRGRG